MAIDGVDPFDPINGGGFVGVVNIGLTAPLTTAQGGLGATTLVAQRNNLFNIAPNSPGDLYYRTSGTAIGRLGIGNLGEVLTVGVGNTLVWGAGGAPGTGAVHVDGVTIGGTGTSADPFEVIRIDGGEV